MEVENLSIPGLLLIRPKLFGDARGSFAETYRESHFREITGKDNFFVQDNESHSKRGVFRGLHYQLPPAAQAKLVRVVRGKILDVVVDLRKSSAHFGRFEIVELSEKDPKAFFIPEGFAHGFLSLEEGSVVQYKTSSYYRPETERSLHYSHVDFVWPIPPVEWIVSDKDQKAEVFDLLKSVIDL